MLLRRGKWEQKCITLPKHGVCLWWGQGQHLTRAHVVLNLLLLCLAGLMPRKTHFSPQVLQTKWKSREVTTAGDLLEGNIGIMLAFPLQIAHPTWWGNSISPDAVCQQLPYQKYLAEKIVASPAWSASHHPWSSLPYLVGQEPVWDETRTTKKLPCHLCSSPILIKTGLFFVKLTCNF